MLALFVLWLGSLAVPATATASTPGLAITGYQVESDPTQLITRDAAALSTVGVQGVHLRASGHSVSRPDRAARRQLAVAHRDHLRAILLFDNFDRATNSTPEPRAHRLLEDRTALRSVARTLASYVRRGRWNGISVDLESLRRRDAAGLVRFVRALRRALPRGATLAIDVQNFAHPVYYRRNGFDLRALGRAVTQLVLMCYDQHGIWENVPGPVGALGWARRGLAHVLRLVSRRKVVLGVAGYGYRWGPRGNRYVGDAQARRIVARDRVRPRFDARVGEWTVKLPNGAVLWWSDARSYALRVSLARRLHLRGLALWSLAQSDPLYPNGT